MAEYTMEQAHADGRHASGDRFWAHACRLCASTEMTLDVTDLQFLYESLQRDAVGLLHAGTDTGHPTYRANREMFGRVWDALHGGTR
jgi:hypothetical protein